MLLLLVLSVLSVRGASLRSVAADDPNIAYIGRFDRSDPKQAVFMYSGCMIRTVFTGTSVTAVLRDAELKNFFEVVLDGRLSVLTANRADGTYALAQGLPNSRHTLEIIRRTEWHGGNTTFAGLRIDSDATLLQPEMSAPSLTGGAQPIPGCTILGSAISNCTEATRIPTWTSTGRWPAS